ncbi:hypothetical protein AAVH_35324, partial [Aphelenchoides avenae]
DDKDVRFVAFDFESTQDQETSPGKFQHRVNCVCAQVFCTKCISNDKWRQVGPTGWCEICGPERERSWLESDGINPLREFMDWLLGLYDKYRTYAFSHYGGRYDMILILKEIYRRQGLAPSVIQTGNKLYEIDVPLKKGIVARTTFRDSYNLMSRPLGDLVEAFQLGIEEKQFFPHLYNKACNYNASARRTELPPLEDYCPLGMKPGKYQKFVKWYEENRHTDFYLPEKLLEYCLSDVEILKHALVSFRREWIDITGDDVLQNATTIASACIRHFRLNHLEKESLVISPEFGYERHDNQSVIALKWLKWYAQEKQVFVQHRDSQGGEKRIDYVCADGTKRSLKLDGFVDGPQPLALEFHGCAWHGCPQCFPNRQMVCPNGRTAEMNYAETKAREAIIRQHMDLKTVWECDVQAQLKTRTKTTEKMRKFFEDCPSYGPIEPRDAYFGGRTGPLRLCFETEGRDDLEISYLDIQSLYPYTNYVTEYPLGKPDVTVLSQDVRWTHSWDNPYNGLLKVKVLPPWDLFLPVLPMKFDERLLFPLCRSCAIEYKDKSTLVAGYSCTHSAEQRAFVTTTTHNELNVALDRGYIVTYVDRVWTWQTWSANLFKSYVAQFMKIKAEASGWPSDNMTDAEKQAYIDENRRRYGIELDANNMVKNPGRRHIAKLCLNSLWGRFSMRNNLTKSEIIESPAKFAELVHDARFDVHSADMVSDTAAFVKYSHRDEFVEENSSSNIFVSLWTTSAARLILYSHMEKVQTTPGCELLYTDTDSIIFVHPKGMNPVEKGQFLGQMGDECPKHHIVAFYSGGAKQYSLKKVLKADPSKVRGITLNEGTCRRLHFDSFKEQVLHYGNIDPLFVDTTQFELSKFGTIHTVHRNKRYRATCQKNIIDP